MCCGSPGLSIAIRLLRAFELHAGNVVLDVGNGGRPSTCFAGRHRLSQRLADFSCAGLRALDKRKRVALAPVAVIAANESIIADGGHATLSHRSRVLDVCGLGMRGAWRATGGV